MIYLSACDDRGGRSFRLWDEAAQSFDVVEAREKEVSRVVHLGNFVSRDIVENPRDERVYLRATPDELARWRSAAKKRGLTFSAWLRQVLDRSAARVGR